MWNRHSKSHLSDKTLYPEFYLKPAVRQKSSLMPTVTSKSLSTETSAERIPTCASCWRLTQTSWNWMWRWEKVTSVKQINKKYHIEYNCHCLFWKCYTSLNSYLLNMTCFPSQSVDVDWPPPVPEWMLHCRADAALVLFLRGFGLDCTGSICCWIPVRPQCWTVSKRVLTVVVKPSRCLEERKTQIIATVLSVGLSALSGFIFHLHIIDCESWVWSNLINNSALVLFWVFSGPSGQSSLYVKMKNMLLPFLCTYWYLFAFN